MFFKTKASPEQKGELTATFLPGFAIHGAEELTNQVPQIAELDAREGTLDLLFEMFAFFMHLANRLAFRELGAQQCSAFSQHMIATVADRLMKSLGASYSSVQVLSLLRDKYNERENYYGRFPQLMAAADQPKKNTVFWEFSKVIFNEFVRTDDTIDLIVVDHILAMEIAGFLAQIKEVWKK